MTRLTKYLGGAFIPPILRRAADNGLAMLRSGVLGCSENTITTSSSW